MVLGLRNKWFCDWEINGFVVEKNGFWLRESGFVIEKKCFSD